MQGCCNKVIPATHVDNIKVDKYTYCVTIHYCKNCGSLKTTTHVRHIRNDNKTKH